MKATEQFYLSYDTVYYAVQAGSNFWVCGWNPKVLPFRWKLLRSSFLWYCCYAPQDVHLMFESVCIILKCDQNSFPVVLFIILYKVVLTFESVDEILKCYHSDESYWAVLSCGTVYYAVKGGSILWFRGWNPNVWPFKWKLLEWAGLYSGSSY